MGNLDTPSMYTHMHAQGECHVRMKAEIEAMPPRTKELHPFPANHQKLKVRYEMEFSFMAFKKNQKTDTSSLFPN